MPSVTMVESQALSELAVVLYDFLPASFSAVTWQSVAEGVGVHDCWPNTNSKRQAIPIFLKNVLEHRRGRFCDLVVKVVQEGMNYRRRKENPLTRDEINSINRLLLKVHFKIPELHDRTFLDGLPASNSENPATPDQSLKLVSPKEIESLHQQFLTLFTEQDERQRGFSFESFLANFFSIHGLDSRKSFRIVGEQIDGSFEWHGNTFLVEARWRAKPANAADLLVLRGKAEKSDWTRGLFISVNGFSDLSVPTLQVGRRANLIAMSGQDLILILEQHWTLHEALRVKLRHTGESAEAFKPLSEFSK